MKRYFTAILFLALTACGAPQSEHGAASEHAASQTLDVRDAWAAPTPGGIDVSAGYLTIANNTGAEDRLLSVTSPRAERVEIHEMSMDGAVMQMRQVTALAVAPGTEATLAPGGMHLMFIGVTQPFQEGESIPAQLTFEHAGVRDVTLPVRRGAPDMGH